MRHLSRPDILRLRLEVLRLLRLVERRLVVLLTLASLVSGILPLAFTLSVGLLVGAIPTVVRQGLDSPDGARLWWLLGVTTVLFAVIEVLEPLQEALRNIIRRQVDERLREETVTALSRPAGIAHLEDPELRGHLMLIQEGSPMLECAPGGAAVTTVQFLTIYLQGLGGAVLVGLSFSWLAAGALLAGSLLARRHLRRGQLDYIWTSLEPEQEGFHRRYHYDRALGIGAIAAKESRVFGLTDWFVTRFRDDWRDAFYEVDSRRARLFVHFGVAYALLAAVYTIVFVFAADAASSGTLALGNLAVVLKASFDVAVVSRQGRWDWELEFGTAVLPKLQELAALNIPPVATPASPPATGEPSPTVAFEGLGFRYAGNPHDVLRDLELSIPSGRSLAIVGPTVPARPRSSS